MEEIYSGNSNIHVPYTYDTLKSQDSNTSDSESFHLESFAENSEMNSNIEIIHLENDTAAVEHAADADGIEENIVELADDTIIHVDGPEQAGINIFKRQLSQQGSLRKKKSKKSAIDSLVELQNARSETQKLKFQLEEKRLQLQQQQLDLEREKLLSQEKIEKLRLEKEERIAKYEIECKYLQH